MIKISTPVFPELSFDEESWRKFKNHLGSTVVILSENSKSKIETEKILKSFHYSPNYKIFDWSEFTSEKGNFLEPLLNKNDLMATKKIIQKLMDETRPLPNSTNGVFILVKDAGHNFVPHAHTLDSYYRADIQRVVWWNASHQLPQLWFEQNGQRDNWPTEELEKTNSYELDTKKTHGGDKVKELTLFFITFARDLGTN